MRLRLAAVKGISDVAPIQEEGLPEVVFRTDRVQAGHYGINGDQIGRHLKVWILGDTSNNLQVGADQVPIRIVLDGGKNQPYSSLLSRNINTKKAGNSTPVLVPLTNVTTAEAGAGPAVINRENRRRILRVNANIATGYALGDVVSEVKKILDDTPLPSGMQMRLGGQADQMKELFTNILIALGLGLLFVYMVLASLFESFVQPITVMAAIPLAATGAVAGLLLTGLPLDLYGGIGVILLAGIVAKNSILLVDFATHRVQSTNEDPLTAILQSAPLRLRPIIMTSLAMIVGMLPVAIGWGSGGAARQGLGVATIGGVLSSTVLTLAVVPSLFVAITRMQQRWKAFSHHK